MTDDFTGELDYRLKHTNSEVGKLSEVVSGLEFEINRLNQDLFNVRDELNNQIHLLRSELTHLIKIANQRPVSWSPDHNSQLEASILVT